MQAIKAKRQKSIKRRGIFLEKLFRILDSKVNMKLIYWSEDGHIINIPDPYKFCNKILPKYFKFARYASFLRQLNLYGFHKILNKNSKNQQFINEDFTKYKTLEEIKEIQMKIKNPKKYNSNIIFSK